MGLDMFLTVKPRSEFGTNKANYEVGYWRKANQIHNWLVNNVQNGVDDCGEYEVSYEKLEELKNLCQKVLSNRSLAYKLLPTAQGFFFGSAEYDEYYFEDVEKTIAICEHALLSYSDGDAVYYSSSW